MRAFRNSTAGIGLAALGALGLSALATPSSAQTFGWVQAAGGGPLPSVYAEQAVALAQAGSTLGLPGGVTWTSAPFNELNNPNQTAIIMIQLPQDDHLVGCTTASTDGTGGFSGVQNVQCFTIGTAPSLPSGQAYPTNGDVIQIIVGLTQGTATGVTGAIKLGTFAIAGTSPGLVMLNPAGTLLNNPNKTTEWCTVATNYVDLKCDLFAMVRQTNNNGIASQQGFNTATSTVMATSKNAKGVKTFGPSYSGYTSICVDMLYPYAPGEEFQENCYLGSSSNHTSVADKGVIQLDLLALEAQVENLNDTLTFKDPQKATIIISGRCGGLQLENIGSVPASCGLQPYTGENPWLIPIGLTAQGQPDPSSTPPVLGAGEACPYPTVAGQPPNTANAIQGVIGPAGTATFSNVPEPVIAASTLPDGSDWYAYYEFCDYATEQAVIADSSGWTVKAEFDCHPALNDCTKVNEQGVDALLPIQINGKAFYVNFTNGAFGQIAFLRIVNDMKDLAPIPSDPNQTCHNDGNTADTRFNASVPGLAQSLAAAQAGLLDKTLTCEPVAQVICKVTTDDGYNGYASLFTNQSGLADADKPGLLSGTNYLYPVYEIFQNAGVPVGTSTNPFSLGSLICYHPYGVYIEQVQADGNGTIVNIK